MRTFKLRRLAALITSLALPAAAGDTRSDDDAAREPCGDLYGTIACSVKLGNRMTLCHHLVFEEIVEANGFHAGVPLKQAEVLLSETEGIPEEVTRRVYQHPMSVNELFSLQRLCVAGRPLVALVPPPAPPPDPKVIDTLVKRWRDENEECRGGHDPEVTCAARSAFAAKLRSLGWCYDYEGAAGTDWHVCRGAQTNGR